MSDHHVYLHVILESRDRGVERKLDQILAALGNLQTGEHIIMSDLSAIQDAVTNETSVEAGAISLLNQIGAELAAAANDPAAVQALADSITSNSAALAAAVAANTPVATGDPVPPVVDTPPAV